jgi:hypothetical protein
MSVNALKARAAQLSFKKATQGLSEAEEQELQSLRQQIALAQAAGGGESA